MSVPTKVQVQECVCACAHKHRRGLTAEFSGGSDLPLLDVDLRVDRDATVVSHPKGLDHSHLQRLHHVLLRHMEDPQVRKTGKKKEQHTL